eukprot:PhF_6_TR10568/c1_g1_i2/m.16832/K17916/KIF16B, SNX23; kinesin family member 16B
MSGDGGESVNVTVAVRVRPMNPRERADPINSVCVFAHGETRSVTVTHPSDDTRTKTFTFDRAFNSMDVADRDYATQQEVFTGMGLPALNHAFAGYNTCIFAYGQTGSGKTYTMMGFPEDIVIPESERVGLIPRVFNETFQRISSLQSATKAFRVHISYYEIYNERPACLIDPDPSLHYRVREHPVTGPYVENISVLQVRSAEEVLDVLRRASQHRHTAATKMNDTSSRSHAVCTVTITCSTFQSGDVCETFSRMNLVDLAGSERSSSAGTSGIRLQEGSNINKSLLTLGNVIEALASSSSGGGGLTKGFVPYRDSVLTLLLKDALGGNSRTIMLAMISPSVLNYEETVNTLKYADRAKKITNIATVNVDSKKRMIFDLRNEIAMLRAQLQKYKDMSKMALSAEENILRLHREDPFLMQLQPVASTTEPLMFFINEGLTEVTSEANPSIQNEFVNIIKLNKRFEVLPSHCFIERKGTSVNLRGGSASGELSLNEEVIGLGAKLPIRSGNIVNIGEYSFKFVNPNEHLDERPARGARRKSKVQRDLHDTIQSTLSGVVEAQSMAALETKGEVGDKIAVKMADGSIALYQWDDKETKWTRIAADDVEECITSMVAGERAEAQMSQRIGSIISEVIKPSLLPQPHTLAKTHKATEDAEAVVTYDPQRERYAVYEVRDGAWRKASPATAELVSITFAAAQRLKDHTSKQQASRKALDEKCTTLAQAKEALARQLEEQERQLSERHVHLQNIQLAAQHVKHRLARKEALLVEQLQAFEKELTEIQRDANLTIEEMQVKCANIDEQNHRLEEKLESKIIEIDAKMKLLAMVDEAKDKALANLNLHKQQQSVLQKQHQETVVQLTHMKRTREDMEAKVRKQTEDLLQLQKEISDAKHVPEGSIRAQRDRARLMFHELEDQMGDLTESLEAMSVQYTTLMQRDREDNHRWQDLSEEVQELTNQYANISDTLQNAEAECAHLEEDVKKSRQLLATLEAENTKMKDKVESTLEKAREKEREAFHMKVQERGKEVKRQLEQSSNTHANEIRSLQKEKQQLRTSAQQMEEKVIVDKQRIATLEKDLEKKDKRIVTLKEEVAQVQKDAQSYMSSSSRKDIDKQILDAEREERSIISKLTSNEQTLKDKKSTIDKHRATSKDITKEHANLTIELEAISQHLKAAEKELKDAKQEKADVTKQHQNAVASFDMLLKSMTAPTLNKVPSNRTMSISGPSAPPLGPGQTLPIPSTGTPTTTTATTPFVPPLGFGQKRGSISGSSDTGKK